jgi:hypothetical protein
MTKKIEDFSKDELKFENKDDFSLYLIKPNIIKHREWHTANYLDELINDSFCSIVNSTPQTFGQDLGKYLQVDKYEMVDVKVVTFLEEPNYIYEIIYIDLFPVYQTEDNLNEFALMLQNSDHKTIYGNALIMKTHISLNSNSMLIEKITSNDIKYILETRVNTKAILYDNGDYIEQVIIGSMEEYAQQFFEEEDRFRIEKLEIPFLKYNINIWFTKFEYGEEGVCGNILKNIRINKCIVFTLINDNYRGNLSMDEFNKIKFLSTKLEHYGVPEEFTTDEKDELGRYIVKNKYKVLESMYRTYKNHNQNEHSK